MAHEDNEEITILLTEKQREEIKKITDKLISSLKLTRKVILQYATSESSTLSPVSPISKPERIPGYSYWKVVDVLVCARKSTVQALEMKLNEENLAGLLSRLRKTNTELSFAGWDEMKGMSPNSETIPSASPIEDDQLLMELVDQFERSLKGETELTGETWIIREDYFGAEEDYMENEYHGIATAFVRGQTIECNKGFMWPSSKPHWREWTYKRLALGAMDGRVALLVERSRIRSNFEWAYALFKF